MYGQPNIILIVCDTLGAKHMSLYGYHRRTTPNLDRLVTEKGCVVYNKCFSTSCWTTPAHASLFTGLYPGEHGVKEDYCYLNANFLTLADQLTEMGYETYGISSNGLVGHPTGLSRGFRYFSELERWVLFSTPKNRMAMLLNILWGKYKASNGGRTGVLRDSTPYTLKAFAAAKQPLADNQKPCFLFLNLMQTHHRYNPPSPFKGTWSDATFPGARHSQDFFRHYAVNPFTKEVLRHFCDLYDEDLLFLDSQLGLFIDFLKRTTDYDNTLLIITSDHGESFGEEGHAGHVFSLHNPLTWVPLIIKYPAGVHGGGGSVNDITQLNDIYATICEVAGSPYPVPESSISVLSLKRDLARMEILRPDIWMQKIKKINRKFDRRAFPYEYQRKAIVYGNVKKVVTEDIREGRFEIKTYDIRDMRNEVLSKIEPANNADEWPEGDFSGELATRQ
jgi:arylsulfatase A-like enzyme